MKNVIAITACLKRCSIAISYENNLYEINEESDAATNLVWLANELVRLKSIELKKIEGIITASGPGSFTGIRTAQSFAKGLSLSLKLPSASISYFDVIQFIYGMDHPKAEIIAVIKSEKNQVYYKNFSDKEKPEGVSSYEILSELLKSKPMIVVGDAIDEIAAYTNGSRITTQYISDFKKAKYLLNFSTLITEKTKIQPLYINAQFS